MCGRTETAAGRRMVRALAGAAAALTVRYGGGFLLALAGLGWRCWVRNLMVLALCVLLFQGIWYGLQVLGERPGVRGRWPEIVLGMAGGAALAGLSLTALGVCLYLRAPGRGRLAVLAAALGCVLVLQYGGGALLEGRGLFWRGWVQTALSLTGGGLAVLLLAGTIRGLGTLCLGKDWVTAVCVLGCAAALLGAAACAGAGLLEGGGREQVVRLAGETLVVRDADLLHQVGWRYVNLFVHGEPLACWRVS